MLTARECRTLETPGLTGPRVLHIVPALFGSGGIYGGAERYVYELARHMAQRTPTTLVSFGDRNEEIAEGPLRIRVLRRSFLVRGQANNPLSLAVIGEIRRADVLHCHQQHIAISSLAAAAGQLLRRKTVVSDLGGGGWDISSYLSTDRWYHAHLHISQYSREVSGHANQPWAHVIYGGIDTRKFSPAASSNSAGRPVLYVGRLLPHKGIDSLIDALPEDLELRLIGRPYDARYFDYLKEIARNKRVDFRLDASDADIVEAYRNCLCIVLPSVYRDMYGVESKVPELLGQTLLEGMACGRPAICTRVASMPEVVEDGRSGFVVPPNDPAALRSKLQWLAQNPARASEMGRLARARVLEHFTWDTVVERCLDIYNGNAADSADRRRP